MNPINIQYCLSESPEEASYATWDLANDDEIVLPDMITNGSSTATIDDLRRNIDLVVANYEEA